MKKFAPLIGPACVVAVVSWVAHRLAGEIGLGAALAGAGLWQALPRGRAAGRRLGAVVGCAGLGVLAAAVLRAETPWSPGTLLFYSLAATTVVSAAAAVSLKSPVYCAIWFALTLLGTAGLMLYQGAQFLGLATVVVYAGAILVTFLFVLMLAQPEGHAYYDRVSWDAFASAAVGAALAGVLTGAVLASDQPREPRDQGGQVLHEEHTARLGGELFGKHLVAVEAAGTLLLIALVGAIAIVGQAKGADGTPPGRTATPSATPRGGPAHG